MFGVPDWKRRLTSWFPERKFIFVSEKSTSAELAKLRKKIVSKKAEVFVWASGANTAALKFVEKNKFKCAYIDEGFVGTHDFEGNSLPPFSLLLDSKAPCFDARKPTDLENLINGYDFSADSSLLEKSAKLMTVLLEKECSKYNVQRQIDDVQVVYGPKENYRVLVIGQPANARSVLYGSERPYTNSDIVAIAASENPDAQIIYKPHPLELINRTEKAVSDIEHPCLVIDKLIPISQALETVDHVYTVSSLAGFEALMRGIKVTALGCPFYAGWGLTDDRQPNERRQRRLSLHELFAAAYLLYPKYYDAENVETTPELFFEKVSEQHEYVMPIGFEKDPESAKTTEDEAPGLESGSVESVAEMDDIRTNTFVIGAPQWREHFVSWFPERKVAFIPRSITLEKFTRKFGRIAADPQAEIFIWAEPNVEVIQFIAENNFKCTYVQEGFFHSVGPRVGGIPPYSLTMDSCAPYSDSTGSSDLECLLNSYDFAGDPELMVRADKLMSSLLFAGLSKYNHVARVDDIQRIYGRKEHRRILVLGQIEDESTIMPGATTNSDLLMLAATENPDAQIIYKPHPNMMSKKRTQSLVKPDVQPPCLFLEQDIPISQALETIDHVYTVSSLAGFEALLRGIKVTTLGCPFYSGWGLTDDRQLNSRRNRTLTTGEIFAAAYVLYPRYYDPETKHEIPPEVAFELLRDKWEILFKPKLVTIGKERKKKSWGGFGRIKRILITSDFLMTKEKEQESNRRWMLDLLRRPIRMATGIFPASFSSSLVDSQRLSRSHFFDLSEIELNIDSTQFWFDDTAISTNSVEYLATHLGPEDLIIGYELSEQTRRLLDHIGVPWVDIWLHPIRFLDDILFAFSSSEQSVYEAIKSFRVSEDVFYLYADRLRIQFYKGYRRPVVPVEPGSALFVGQTLDDKAVCRRGKMLNVLHFKKEFEAAGAEYGHVSYSRHPYVRKGDEAILRYVKNSGFAQVVDYPAYHLLASGKIAKAFSVSSSVVYEAKYFGLKTEFLFKPVIRYGEQYGREHLSIYQEFVSPHFWSKILRPIMPTRDCERVMFLEGKDKLRDMLNFYWSYRIVDKTEDMRQTLIAVDRRVQTVAAQVKAISPPAVKKFEPVKPGRAWRKVMREITALMDAHDVITFDIFDTLIARPFEKPEHLFDFVEPQMLEITGDSIPAFRRARMEAKQMVKDGTHGEEITLDERYRALAAHYGLPDEAARQMMDIELSAETRFCQRRETGWAVYRAALEMGKRIAFVSDTFFSGEFVREILSRNGYDTEHPTYLSSEYGKLKHTGNLYPVVAEDLGVAPEKILHIGDDSHSDIKMAKAAGFSTFCIPGATASFNRSLLSKSLNVSDPVMGSVIRGLAARRLAGNPWGLPTPSYVGGYRRSFGYAVAGPIFFGFAKWILEQAMQDGMEVLYFLSRDGDIVKRCYDILAPYYPGAPKSVYLRASRRGVNVPALRSEPDVLDMLEVNFTPCRISELLEYRFGLDGIPLEALQKAEYSSVDDLADYKRDSEKLRFLLHELTPRILENAQSERENLLAYYAEQGLMDRGIAKAIVDIGHHGSLQASISKLAGEPSLGGYYFVTDKEIENRVHALGMSGKGYLADCINMKEKNHPYTSYLLMFEAIFLNDEGSFVRMTRGDGGLTPEFLPLDKEAKRIDFIRKVHDAVTEFTRDIAEVLGPDLCRYPLDGNSAASGYLGMLSKPAYLEARMFNAVAFENVYSGRDSRSLIHVVQGDPGGTLRGSLWREGAEIINAYIAGAHSPAKRLK